MPRAEHWLIKQCAELQGKDKIKDIPANRRGVYALLKKIGNLAPSHKEKFEVVYVGMSRGEKLGIKNRLQGHAKSKRKGKLWTHFSIFEVHDNIDETQVQGLEGLFRHIYRRDPRTNILNRQRGSNQLRKIRQNDFREWS